MSARRQKSLIVWASGLIQFIDGTDEPEGAIRICTATGDDAILFLFEQVKEAAQLHEFDDAGVALKVPGFDPRNGNHWSDPVDLLIDWDAQLYHEIGPDADFEWKRPRELVA